VVQAFGLQLQPFSLHHKLIAHGHLGDANPFPARHMAHRLAQHRPPGHIDWIAAVRS